MNVLPGSFDGLPCAEGARAILVTCETTPIFARPEVSWFRTSRTHVSRHTELMSREIPD
jgi:hypothetical protein